LDSADVFVNAARAFSALLADPDGVSPGGLHDRLRVEATTREGLLAAFLNELGRLFEREREIFCRFQPRRVTDTLCEIEADGELWDPGRHRAGHTFKPLSAADVTWTAAPGVPPIVRLCLSVQSPPS
jgi:SHS2 domain-containing protein